MLAANLARRESGFCHRSECRPLGRKRLPLKRRSRRPISAKFARTLPGPAFRHGWPSWYVLRVSEERCMCDSGRCQAPGFPNESAFLFSIGDQRPGQPAVYILSKRRKSQSHQSRKPLVLRSSVSTALRERSHDSDGDFKSLGQSRRRRFSASADDTGFSHQADETYTSPLGVRGHSHAG